MTKTSILGRKWKAKQQNEGLTKQLKEQFGLSDLQSALVSNRADDIFAAHDFIDPKIKKLMPDPYHLKSMDRAVDRLVKAILNGENICIFADYDVDGATSSALIKNILTEIGANVSIYVPDRIDEGYGPSKTGMDNICEAGNSLVISVDCGTVAFDALEYASSIGLDVIVIDHHISLDILPKAIAIVNPNRLDQESSCKDLAAVGVCFLYMAALVSALDKQAYFTEQKRQKPNLINQLDLVALGTVCDVVPLTGLNRAFVKQGLKILKNRTNLGLRALVDIAGVDSEISTYHLGFVLGPRINAGGRVGKSDLGANLLSCQNADQAGIIALELHQFNNDRQVIQQNILDQAEEIAATQEDSPFIFVAKEGWHPGVIGIAAGRLKEKYNKPVAVIAINDGVAKASCRSIKGLDFGSGLLMAKESGLLIAGGGHAMAAGFTAEENKLVQLKEFLANYFSKAYEKIGDDGINYYQRLISASAITVDLAEEISIIEPIGSGNSEPLFCIEDVFVLRADIVAGKHLRILFAPTKDSSARNGPNKSAALKAMIFNSTGSKFEQIILDPKSKNMSIIASIKINNWQNKKTAQLMIKDIIL